MMPRKTLSATVQLDSFVTAFHLTVLAPRHPPPTPSPALKAGGSCSQLQSILATRKEKHFNLIEYGQNPQTVALVRTWGDMLLEFASQKNGESRGLA